MNLNSAYKVLVSGCYGNRLLTIEPGVFSLCGGEGVTNFIL